MRILVMTAAFALSACGVAIEPAASDRPNHVENNPLESNDVTVQRWQEGTDDQRWAATYAHTYAPNARDDQRERIARLVSYCLDREILRARPEDRIFDPTQPLFYECLNRYTR